MTMMAAYSRVLMLMVSPMCALAARAWMWSGHWMCHQNLRSVENPRATCDNESKYATAEWSLGMRWTMGQHRETEISIRIDVMRAKRLCRSLEKKCWFRRRWVALAVLAMVNDLWLVAAVGFQCNLSRFQNCLLDMHRWF